jgi:hypothetical protein
MPYFVIHNSEGETCINQLSKEQLLKRIKPEVGEKGGHYGEVGFLPKIEESDTNYWGDNILIIKGDIIVPKPIEVVKEYEI